jgi:uncharacterized protein
MLTHSPLFVGIVVLGLTLLATRISLMRLSEKTQTTGSKQLQRAVRLHANNVEHGAPFCVLLVVMELQKLGAAWVVGSGVAYLAIRLMHGVGYTFRIPVFHRVGAGLNYTVLAVAAVRVLTAAL